jgi:hypothetical protein
MRYTTQIYFYYLPLGHISFTDPWKIIQNANAREGDDARSRHKRMRHWMLRLRLVDWILGNTRVIFSLPTNLRKWRLVRLISLRLFIFPVVSVLISFTLDR